jgi:hypothetical protein
MINHLPSKLKLPNFSIFIEFEPSEEHEYFGKIYAHDYKIVLADKNEEFNKYLFFSFMCFMVGSVFDMNIPDYKAYPLGAFLYSVFENNDILKMMKNFRKKQKFDSFVIDVPTFSGLTVSHHLNKSHPLGSAAISSREISIYYKCKPELKDVILIHELVEWVNSIYRLRLSHQIIQTLSEVLTYVIKNNKGVVT